MRLAYAGESTIERRRVESEKEVSEEDFGGDSGSDSGTGSSAAICQENSSISRLFA